MTVPRYNPPDGPTPPDGFARPRAQRRGRWRAVLIGAVAVALVATATVVTIQSVAERPPADGVPWSVNPPPGAEPTAAEAHEPQQVAEFGPGRYPKHYGRPSAPDPAVMEIHGRTAYFAYTTSEIIHVTAVNLAGGTVKWRREVDLNANLGAISMVATDAGLLLVINFPDYAQFSITLDPENGKDIWYESKPHLTVGGVVDNHLIVYNSDEDTVLGYAMATKKSPAKPIWSIDADGGRYTEIFQETAATHRQPRDDGELAQTLDVGANSDDGQYIVNAAMYSGAVSVRELATGTELSKGNAGEKMVDIVAYEDTVYVYRQTPRTLAAYPATDLSRATWSVTTPPSGDGSDLELCADGLLCLKTVTQQGTPVHAIDATNGQVRWQTGDYRAAAPDRAGEVVAVSHQGGTALLDPKSGDVVTEFSSAEYALPGNGTVIGVDDEQLRLLRPGDTEPRSLGPVPDEAMTAGTCEWTSEVALCAGEESYRLWRYRS